MQPVLGEPFTVGGGLHVIPSYFPVPGVGILPVNAFVLQSAEPVLIDTGPGVLSDAFIEALASIIPLRRLRWIWLTHEDRDHTGSLRRLLDLAPEARVVSSFFAIGRMLPEGPFPLDRVRLVTQGESLNVGDRNLVALRPPAYDSPATVGFLDDRSGTLFSSDCFGAPMPTHGEAAVHDITELSDTTVAQAQLMWAHVDSPWVATVDRDAFARSIQRIERLAPETILSSHLPPVRRTEQVLTTLREAPQAEPPPEMTQTQLEALLAEFEVAS